MTMNRLTLVSSSDASRSDAVDLLRLEREARRLRLQHGDDALADLAIALDLQVRRVAHRIAARLYPQH